MGGKISGVTLPLPLTDFPAPGEVLRVLHLDDDPLDQELVSDMLSGAGLPWQPEVTQVSTRAEFLEALRSRPHAVVSDYSLPGYDGMSAFDAARAQIPNIPFIIVTGAMGEEVAVDTLRRGVTDYVLKQRLELLPQALSRAVAEAAEKVRREVAESEIRALNAALQQRLGEVEHLNRLATERGEQLEETAQQLSEALKLQKTFLAETSHELRTPLTALLGYLRRVEREVQGMGGDSQTLRDAQRVAENMTRLVNDLLQLSRGELVQSIEPHFVNLGELLRAVGRDYGVEVDSPNLEIVADPGRLTQVFVNLVSNALRVCGSPDKVRLKAEQVGEEVVVSVIDRGPGIPNEVKPRIFDKFYRGKEAGSAGLGLTIAQQVTQAHQGRIEVLDTPGGGATFAVHLPALSEDDDDDWALPPSNVSADDEEVC